jgi:hypothetical protein
MMYTVRLKKVSSKIRASLLRLVKLTTFPRPARTQSRNRCSSKTARRRLFPQRRSGRLVQLGRRNVQRNALWRMLQGYFKVSPFYLTFCESSNNHSQALTIVECDRILNLHPSHRPTLPLHLSCMQQIPNMRSRLFLLAHELVDNEPDDAISWYAVGLWYFAGRRWEESRRFFGYVSIRSKHLSPPVSGFPFTSTDELLYSR